MVAAVRPPIPPLGSPFSFFLSFRDTLRCHEKETREVNCAQGVCPYKILLVQVGTLSLSFSHLSLLVCPFFLFMSVDGLKGCEQVNPPGWLRAGCAIGPLRPSAQCPNRSARRR